jgi:cellulose synthase/poly-beta-1,6-N-acetylglucosamine synthase-like glycosyltransferase
MIPTVRHRPRGAPWSLLGGVGLLVITFATFGLTDVVDALAIGAQVVFVVFFLRHVSFAISAFQSVHEDLDAPVLDTGYRPSVTVLVACKNEESVIDAMLDSLLRLDYPSDHLQVLVVDDASTDGTGTMLDERARSDRRLDIVHREAGAGGGKPGALNEALGQIAGEIVVVFDADHSPRPNVLRHLVRHFEDPGVGAAQGRCEVRNASDSPLTRLVAIDYLAGYLVNEYGRQSVFRLPAYGGANCAVRTEMLRKFGGWNTSSVTEDTDLTLRLVLAGKRVRFDVTAVDEEEGVVNLRRYWTQRYRWARGHQRAWRDYRAAVWRSTVLSPLDKVETTLFLLAFHLPIVSAIGLLILGAWLAGVVHPIVPFDLSVFWMLLFIGPLLELGGGLLIRQADRHWALSLMYFLPLFVVSALLCTKAWIDGLLGRPYTWVKTRRAGDSG